MLSFLLNNLGTILIFTLLLAIVGTVIYKMIGNKKKGKTSCSCGCAGCSMSEVCHKRP